MASITALKTRLKSLENKRSKTNELIFCIPTFMSINGRTYTDEEEFKKDFTAIQSRAAENGGVRLFTIRPASQHPQNSHRDSL